jgi:hypothetical protein
MEQFDLFRELCKVVLRTGRMPVGAQQGTGLEREMEDSLKGLCKPFVFYPKGNRKIPNGFHAM